MIVLDAFERRIVGVRLTFKVEEISDLSLNPAIGYIVFASILCKMFYTNWDVNL
jgi:hypothetical protein